MDDSRQAIDAAKQTGDVIFSLKLKFVAYCESHDVICSVSTIAPWDETVLIYIVADDLTMTKIDLPLPSGAKHAHAMLVAEKITKGKLDGYIGEALKWMKDNKANND